MERITLPYNHSLPPEGNLATLRSSYESLLHGRKLTHTGMGIGLICDCNIQHNQLNELLLNSILLLDAVNSEDAAITKELFRACYGQCVLYISLQKTIRTILRIDDRFTVGHPWERDLFCTLDDLQNDLLQTVAGMARIAALDTVIVEGDVGQNGEADCFLRALAAHLPANVRENLRLEALPAHTVAERGMRLYLCGRYAETWIHQ